MAKYGKSSSRKSKSSSAISKSTTRGGSGKQKTSQTRSARKSSSASRVSARTSSASRASARTSSATKTSSASRTSATTSRTSRASIKTSRASSASKTRASRASSPSRTSRTSRVAKSSAKTGKSLSNKRSKSLGNNMIRKSNLRSTKAINGKRFTQGTNSYNVMRGVRKLSKQNIGYTQNDSFSIDMSSEAMLFSIGCTIVSSGEDSKRDFSLKDTQTDIETIDNENILDSKSLNRVTNNKSSLTDTFTNQDDPMYELDDAPSLRAKKEREEQIKSQTVDVINVAGDVVSENMKSSNYGSILRLKQFQ